MRPPIRALGVLVSKAHQTSIHLINAFRVSQGIFTDQTQFLRTLTHQFKFHKSVRVGSSLNYDGCILTAEEHLLFALRNDPDELLRVRQGGARRILHLSWQHQCETSQITSSQRNVGRAWDPEPATHRGTQHSGQFSTFSKDRKLVELTHCRF
ncbi:hypothetical protein XH98_20740 [Bradyrhizobium sp. CCBAU 51745]|nr:hypothetical protein [Bradyrhizobium sp. CCBAU 51745]